MYNNKMIIDYDPTKSQTNKDKHGIALEEAVLIEWETLLSIPDNRVDYGEPRQIGYAIMYNRLYCIVFTDRGDTRRVISLRKANSREVKLYAEHN